MKKATAISAGLHAAVLLWATFTFTGKTFEVTPAQSLPVDLISEKDFSQITKGLKEAPKLEQPKPVVEKKAKPKPKPIDNLKAKINEKKELKAVAQKVPAPSPVPKTPEKKEAKAKNEPRSKIDPIADKIKEENKQQKEAKIAPVLPPRRPLRPHRREPKFDAEKIAALLDKRMPERNSITGATLNSAPSLGTALGNASQLSQTELDALRARLMALWNPPIGIKDPQDYVIRIRIQLDRTGRLSAPPIVLTSGHGQLFNSARDSAVRAVFEGQPFDMLKPDHYNIWKDIEVTFDPRDMFRG